MTNNARHYGKVLDGAKNQRQSTAQQSNQRKSGKKREHAGRSGQEQVQGLDGDAELCDFGQIRCAMRREGHMHEGGESDTS